MSKNINRPMDNRNSSNNNKAENRIPGALDDLTDKVRNAGRVVGEFVDDSRENLSSIEEQVEDTIRTHPIVTCAAIFVTGVLFGAILKRR